MLKAYGGYQAHWKPPVCTEKGVGSGEEMHDLYDLVGQETKCLRGVIHAGILKAWE